MSIKWTMRQSLFCLIGSTLLTLTMSLGGYTIWKKRRAEKLLSPKYQIQSIIQTGSEKQALQTSYLAELLGLCIDQPTQLYAFDLKKAEEKLLSSPLISEAHITRIPPSTLYIDYEVRKPIAWLADFKNMAVDEKGYFFPVAPFFSPKRLPEIYLGIPLLKDWKVQSPYFDLALQILRFLESAPWKEGLHIQRIDVSNAFAPSLGQREVVIFTEEELLIQKRGKEMICIFPKILRLGTKDYLQQLSNFFSLKRSMMEDYQRQITAIERSSRFTPRIVDLRIPHLAFVEK